MKPSIIEQADNMDALTRGLADQPEQASDQFYDHEVRQYIQSVFISSTYQVANNTLNLF